MSLYFPHFPQRVAAHRMMKKQEVLTSLRALAEELRPFTLAAAAGARKWTGSAYSQGNNMPQDAYALSWWSAISTIADLLERNDSPMSEAEYSYLLSRICGGMGSFADFALDEIIYGPAARKTNKRLDEMRSHFFEILKK
jgi:hypothetical protein